MATSANPPSLNAGRSIRRIGTQPAPWESFLSLFLAIGLLLAIQSTIDTTLVSDWAGYLDIYLHDGSWLSQDGRDPIFVNMMSYLADLFGARGYETFRSALFITFCCLIGFLSFALPRQRSVSPPISAVVIGVALATTFCLKSLVQIREGIAFVPILAAMLLGLRFPGRWVLLVSAVLCFVATGIHAGMIVFALIVMGSWFVVPLGDSNNQLPRAYYWIALSASLSFALAIGWLLTINPDLAYTYLGDVLSSGSYVDQATGAKLAYWSLLGICCAVLHYQCLTIDTRHVTPLSSALAFVFACVLLPITFLIPFVLVLTDFAEASVIATLTRLLFSALQLGVIFLATTRRADWATLAVLGFNLIDQVRTMNASIS